MKKIYSILLCIGLVASFVACEKDKDFALTTLSVANETITPWYESAQVSCSFKADATISEACVQYALSSSFVEYKTAEMAEEKGVYSAQLIDLQSDTMYYVRYVVSNKYSQVVSEAVVDFRTLPPVMPTVVLDTVSEVWDHRAIAQMRLVFNGGAVVTDMGICWGTQPQPTMKDIHRSTDDTLALIDITSLQPNTKYYARAYAVNKVGVAYSEEKEFVTLTQPEVRTDEVRDIEPTSAVLVGKLLFNGNDTATIKGFCWGEKAVPTVDDDQVAIDTLTDEYSYLLSNLKDETQYFVRAYAKNKIGVVYGEERVFTTQAAVVPKVVTKEVKDVDDQSSTVQGEVTSDGGAEVTERGVVYGTSENPTVGNSKVVGGSGTGMFTCNLTDLQPNTKYYVRAYAVNKKGTAYGEQVSFTTLTPSNGMENGYEWVDLGLSVKWATFNVGATKPEEYGDYFAWGETEPKEVYDLSTYVWCNGSEKTLTKYNTVSSRGTVDNKTTLELSDDAAHVNWGGSWRMPTDAELTELREQCTWTWTTQNGVSGYKVTSKKSGYTNKSIFLPAEGFRRGSSLYGAGSDALYWSSSLYADYPYLAWLVGFDSDNVGRNSNNRFCGQSVRPVLGEYIAPIVVPTVTTSAVTQITETSAVAGGNVTADGGASVTERGVVYSTSENPTTANSKVVGGSGTGMFTCNLTGLQPNTKYYVRAYAVNSQGTVYGEQMSFTTLTPIVVPTVMTHVITQIAETTAVAGGNVTADGGASVTERGVVYGTSENPTVGNSKVVGGNGTGMFTCNLTGLQANTKYYVRAYAVNSKGTAYGEQVSFTTLEEVKTTAEYVDLGLSVKWATVNVGATKPEEYGDYFAWGETEPKSTYNWSTYKWCNGSETTLTKYCTDGSYGTVDNKTQLELSDDAAHVNWGSDWRIPTDAELNELVNECTWTWIAQNGVKGYKVIGSNGNSIFLPAAGFRSNSDELTSSEPGNSGVYASRTLVSFGPSYSLYLFFDNENKGWSTMYRYVGYTIRPVYGAMPENSLASVTSSAVTQITETTAVAGGKVTADGGSIVLECGVVYSTSQNPTTANSKVVGGSGTGMFTCNLTGLQANTKYYVRAYAVNSKGTAYGEQVSFTTLEEVSATPEYVDLGLSVKWATFNVGATRPEEYGYVFAWGETELKQVYIEWMTYKWCNGSETTLTKYNNSSDHGTVDNKTQLELSDDAAHANWGGDWRMPTLYEQRELIEQCTWRWTTQNGVNGYTVTSKNNGNSIFLPAAGSRSDGLLENAGNYGGYWSSTLMMAEPHTAYYLYFSSDGVDWFSINRYYGFSVRPVYGEYVPASTMPTVTTSAVTQITETTAVAGGNVTSDDGASVTERGVVYSTSQNPTTANTKKVSGSGTGAFTCNLTDLQASTTYYVRAYAVNSKGTSYGEQVSFTTLEEVSATPEYVDLGLSVKWATFNVGANKPEEYGDYFAWGETEPKEVYDWSTYKWCNGSETTLTKYCTNDSLGTVDNKRRLELSDDAAHAYWGGDWRMPTREEFWELEEGCTWTWTTQNGVNGYKVISKSNGNSIFLPAAGYRYVSSLSGAGSYGRYWLSSGDGSDGANYFTFMSSRVDYYGGIERYNGQSVRPVYGEYVPESTLPVVTTGVVTQIAETTAVAGGNVTADGGASVTERGVVYSTTANPTTANTKKVSGSGTGAFTCNLTGLQASTTYYVRAYAINEKGTAYGEQVSFKTLTPIVPPTITTSAVTQITETTAVAGGNVTSDGGASVTERGVVYGTAENPTVENSKVVGGSGTGVFTCNLADLQAGTTYYVRAYAVNSQGTAYGEQVSFTTLEEVSATPEYVDLGLSVKWATFNVGATKPEEYGDYFAWGETEPKEVYDLSTYVWCNDSEYTLTKYNNRSDQGTVDNKTQLELSDDAAHVNWGGDWRMPTDTEFTELRENCTWTWTTQNGVNGYKVTSNKSGYTNKSIFLPAAGYHYDSSLNNAGSLGYYWSSSLSTDRPFQAYELEFESGFVEWMNIDDRCGGRSVRPVYGEYVPAINLPVIITDVVTQITETTAVAGGNVTSDGGIASVTERGVVYGISENPTVENSKVTSGAGIGAFTCNLTGLQAGTTYYVRAYAVNSQGTAYGEQVSFTTLTPSNGMENGYEWVDLGLSVKWATINVGATKPEEYGDYFAWGETEPKEVYDRSTYKWCNGSETTLTKYCTDDSLGIVDNKTQLELSDDAARVNWGGSWRMPTDAELTELRENCTWTWTTQNGVNGYKVTSKSNGNSIFLPAAGHRYGSSFYSAGSDGDYWSSSLYTDYPHSAWHVYFYPGYVNREGTLRSSGFSVRPVCQ